MGRAIQVFGGFTNFKNIRVLHSITLTGANQDSNDYKYHSFDPSKTGMPIYSYYLWSKGFLRSVADCIITTEKRIRSDPLDFALDPKAINLSTKLYNSKKKKPLVIMNPSLSPTFYQKHPFFVHDDLHDKLVYSSQDKISKLLHEYPDLEESCNSRFNTKFWGVKQPNINDIIEEYRTERNDGLTVIESGMETLIDM